MTGSNRRPSACKADALPAELILQTMKLFLLARINFGDPYGTRTRVTSVKGRCLNRLTKGPKYNIYIAGESWLAHKSYVGLHIIK